MSVFLRNLLLFSIVFVVLTGGMVAYYVRDMRSVKFSTMGGRHILVIGDSHTECAIDDDVFTRCVNLSKSASAYVFSFAVIRKWKADNPELDTVLLSYEHKSLSDEQQTGWMYDESILAQRLPYVLPYFNGGDYWNYKFSSPFYKTLFQYPFTVRGFHEADTLENRYTWQNEKIGMARALTYTKLKEDVAATKPLEKGTPPEKLSEMSIEYIRKIADYCKRKNITLILINTPVYQWEKYVDHEQFETNRKKYFGDILYLDYKDFPLPDSCRADIWHLNAEGQRQFSEYLQKNLTEDIRKQNPSTAP
ncbi:MAG: hypothetical protein JNK79_20505 [Chitinophagaceae bacterium]|nr:hypothetical protein [Chitinophagaceae bacterium]